MTAPTAFEWEWLANDAIDEFKEWRVVGGATRASASSYATGARVFTRDAAESTRQGWLLWSASAGGVMAAAALVRPVVLRPPFVALCVLLFPVGMVVGEVILAAVFYGVFTPLALLARLVGRDPLKRRLDRSAATYWEPREQPRNAARYFCQY